MRLLLIPFFLLMVQCTLAQEPAPFGLKSYTLHHATLGTVNYHITENGFEKTKPVLLYLEGSGCNPFYRVIDDGQNCCLYVNYHLLNLDSLSNRYHIILISKPGVPLSDTLKVKSYDDFKMGATNCNDTYQQKLSLPWRAQAAAAVLNEALQKLSYIKDRVIVMGNSEGGQVAPHAALLNKKITHCINICGSGINQFYTPIIQARMEARKGTISYEAAEKKVDSLFKIYEAIYASKDPTNQEWEGATYQRWSSFTKHYPLDSYIKLNIPIYITIGAKDENGDVLSSDYVKLEFLRLGKQNLTYKVYPNSDHFFNEIVQEDGKLKKVSRIQEVIYTALSWVEQTSR